MHDRPNGRLPRQICRLAVPFEDHGRFRDNNVILETKMCPTASGPSFSVVEQHVANSNV